MAVVKLTPDQIAQITPAGILTQEQGVSNTERQTVKNLISSPEVARSHLERIGYEVRPFGTGFNFAVRKSPDQPWKVVDPVGAKTFAEFVKDMLDLTSDILTVPATAVGAAIGTGSGGPGAGTLAGAAVGASVFEAARQGAGAALGVEGNANATQVFAAGILTAVLPPAIRKTVGITTRGAAKTLGFLRGGTAAVGRVATGLGSKAAAIGDKPGLSATEILRFRAAVDGVLPGLDDTLKIFRTSLRSVLGEKIPEALKADAILEAKGNVRVSIQPTLKILRDATREFFRTGKGDRGVVQKVIDDFNDDLRAVLGTPDSVVFNPTAVPAQVANLFRRRLGDLASFTSVLKGDAPVPSILQKAARKAQKKLNEALIDAVDDPNFAALRKTVQQKLITAESLESAIGTLVVEAGEDIAATGAARQGAKGVLESLFDPRDRTFLNLVRKFDADNNTLIGAELKKSADLFKDLIIKKGDSLESRVRASIVAGEFGGPGGAPSADLRFTATGAVFGPGAGTAIGSLVAGPPGAIAGGLLGLAGASERGVVGATRGLTALSSRIGPRVGQFQQAVGGAVPPAFGTFSTAATASPQAILRAAQQAETRKRTFER